MDFTGDFSRDTLPFILTLFLGWLYVNLSKSGDPNDLSNRVKLNGAIFTGILLGIALMFYEATDAAAAALNFKTWVKYILIGFIVGTSAIGLNQIQKNLPPKTVPEVPTKPQPGPQNTIGLPAGTNPVAGAPTEGKPNAT